MKKKIIFACPTHFGLHQMIIDNLKAANFEVFSLCTNEKFKYKSTKDKIINFIRKTFLRDKEYKRNLYYNYQSEVLEKKLNSLSETYFDYSLIIRPDTYPINIISKIHQLAKKNIGYQWDGLTKFPRVFKRLSLFDKFYVFDKSDYTAFKKEYLNLYYTDNFYSDLDNSKVKKTIDVFYIGSYDKNRFDELYKMYELVKDFQLKIDLQIKVNPKNKITLLKNNHLTFFSNQVNYNESLLKVKSSKIILDVLSLDHKGLSFRFFEGIKYKCKIITNNVNIKDYDFYHPNNIFILQEDATDRISDFINSDYFELEEHIVEKYSFKNWIDSILN